MKEKLIHLLGGHTDTDLLRNHTTAFEQGYTTATCDILEEMHRINGKPADDWARHMYKFVLKQLPPTQS